MSKKSGLFLLTIGAAGGFLAAKYGKQFVETIKSSINRTPIDELVNEIKSSVKQSADEIKKSVEDICTEIEKSCFDEGFLSMSSEDYESKEPMYVKVPVTDINDEIEDIPDNKDDELPPLDIKISEHPEDVRKVVKEVLEKAENEIEEELRKTDSESVNKTEVENS